MHGHRCSSSSNKQVEREPLKMAAIENVKRWTLMTSNRLGAISFVTCRQDSAAPSGSPGAGPFAPAS